MPALESKHKPNNYLYEYLKNGSDPDMAVDGSSNAITYSYTVPSGRAVSLMRFTGAVVDTNVTYGTFGGLVGALSNGCLFRIVEFGGATLDLTNGQNIKTNEDWFSIAGVDAPIEPAAGDDAVPLRITVAKASNGKPMMLKAGDKIEFVVQDNLTDLSHFRLMVQGQIW